jgi:hypothetical protein
MKVNVRKEAQLQSDVSGSPLELDIWIPRLNLAFEFQEAHHYKATQFTYQPVSTIETRDILKQLGAPQQGITLITVPFWWDRTPER